MTAENREPGTVPSRVEPFFARVVAASLLRRDTYDRIVADREATGQAIAVVCLVALAQPTVLLTEIHAWALPVMMVFGVLRWLLFGGVAFGMSRLVVGRGISGAALLRGLGFAEAPAVLNFIVYQYPSQEPERLVLGSAVWCWQFAAVVVAVRAATRASLQRAGLIALASYAVYLLIGFWTRVR